MYMLTTCNQVDPSEDESTGQTYSAWPGQLIDGRGAHTVAVGTACSCRGRHRRCRTAEIGAATAVDAAIVAAVVPCRNRRRRCRRVADDVVATDIIPAKGVTAICKRANVQTCRKGAKVRGRGSPPAWPWPWPDEAPGEFPV